MKNFLASIALLFCIYHCSAQDDTTSQESPKWADGGEVITIVAIDAEFPGGPNAWANFCKKNLIYPAKARRKKIQGTVVVQFIVDKEGVLSDIQAVSGPEELRQAAVDVLRKSPRWSAAIWKGKLSKSSKKVPITFSLQK